MLRNQNQVADILIFCCEFFVVDMSITACKLHHKSVVPSACRPSQQPAAKRRETLGVLTPRVFWIIHWICIKPIKMGVTAGRLIPILRPIHWT